jgi:hypothetical protein
MRLSQEQIELRDLVRGFLQDNVPSEYLRSRINTGVRHDPAFTATLDQLGLLEAFSQEQSTLTFLDLSLVASEVGRFLVPEPLIERLFVDAALRGLVPENERSVVGTQGAVSGVVPASCGRSVVVSEAGQLSGEVSWAYGVEGASRLLAFVERAGELAACIVELNQPGVALQPTTALDLTATLTAITFTNANALFFSAETSKLLQDCFEVLKACEVSGITRRVIEMTVEYVKTREQFGVPVGSFQAIQHKLADAFAQSESLEALSRFAAWSVVSSPDQRPLTARSAIAQACDVGPAVCEACLQAHGGIGFTWEYDLHLFLRRAKATQSAFMMTEERSRDLIERATASS